MRRLILLVGLLVGSLASPVGAVETSAGQEKGTIVVRDSRPGDDQEEAPERASNVTTRRAERYYYRTVLWSAEQGFCISWRSTTDQAYAERQNAVGFALRFDRNTGEPLQNCAPRTSTTAPNLQAIAAAGWEQIEDLPVPTLDIEPDFAITGKKVFLQIGGRNRWTKTIDNPIGDDIVITATSEYVIDWDDPTASGLTVTKSQGGPWPSGDVTHVYVDTSALRQIRVIQRWKASWRAGALTGTLSELRTQAPPLGLEIRELQAVRNR